MDAYYVQSEPAYSSTIYPFTKFVNKPVMIYYFVDPFCYECWSIDKIIKKLTMKYGAFFNVRPVISHLFSGSHTCSKHQLPINQLSSYYLSLGIKAATLQGNKAGRDFLRHLQDIIFLYEQVDSTKEILLEAASQSKLDIDEFQTDLHSSSVQKAYQGDMELIREMNVTQFPTLVLFSQYIDDYSVKIPGLQSFETYSYLLNKMLQMNTNTKQQNIPPLEIYLRNYKRVIAEEVAFVFDLSIEEAINQLKKLQLAQKVEKIEKNDKSFWVYRD